MQYDLYSALIRLMLGEWTLQQSWKICVAKQKIGTERDLTFSGCLFSDEGPATAKARSAMFVRSLASANNFEHESNRRPGFGSDRVQS